MRTISAPSRWTILAIASPVVFMAVCCGSHSAATSEAERTKALAAPLQRGKEPPAPSLPARPIESAERKVKPARTPSPDPLTDKTPGKSAFDKMDWGLESSLDAIIAMAKSDAIQQIDWHVMPNIIRVQARDNRIFHIRNENKGIDMRNALINAGIPIGKGGITFQYVF